MDNFFKDYWKMITEIKALVKDTDNPYFKSQYADLNQVLEVVKKACTDNNFTFIQYPIGLELKTELRHVSGEKIEAIISLVSKDLQDPQKLGSAITYMRRYSLVCMFGLEQEDDDGNKASGKDSTKKTDEKASEKQLDYIRRLVDKKGSNLAEILAFYGISKLPDINKDDAKECIEFLNKKTDKGE